MQQPLNDDQIKNFIQQGFVKIENAFSKEAAEECRNILWKDTGCKPDDPSTWNQPVIRLWNYAQEPFVRAARLAKKLSVTQSREEVDATGTAGTVYLCHPFLVHAAQKHRGKTPRFLAQPPLQSAEDLRLVRPDENYSLVETAIREAIFQ